MAVVITVSKQSVTKVREKLYRITLNMAAMDGEVELINRNFSQYYRTGDVVGTAVNKFYNDMQASIPDYIEEQNIYNAAALDSALVTLKEGLTWQ